MFSNQTISVTDFAIPDLLSLPAVRVLLLALDGFWLFLLMPDAPADEDGLALLLWRKLADADGLGPPELPMVLLEPGDIP